METTKLSTKGQIILPKAVRERRGWKAGTRFAAEEITGGVLLRPLRTFPPAQFDDVFGCLKHKGSAKTLAQMEESIARGVKERHDRGRY
ncbi:MAG TPA: AbrB/MazE/SpoVT family DNA-binding domain-containing protein [Terriglobia bacterium]|nr:AbrB/MazE/SpoVT family DNA-binding domain-containing protein [Terriglobia bacterium]